MRGTFSLDDPGKVEMVIELKATVEEWREIAALVQDPANSAPWQLRNIIQEAMRALPRRLFLNIDGAGAKGTCDP